MTQRYKLSLEPMDFSTKFVKRLDARTTDLTPASLSSIEEMVKHAKRDFIRGYREYTLPNSGQVCVVRPLTADDAFGYHPDKYRCSFPIYLLWTCATFDGKPFSSAHALGKERLDELEGPLKYVLDQLSRFHGRPPSS
jgi:hypothetical protein